MKILVLAPDYPKPGRLFSGIFNERCVTALQELCEDIQVLVPRPYAPPLLSSLLSRWKIYAATPAFELNNGVPVYRPAIPVVPRLASPFWFDKSAFTFCRGIVRKMHRQTRFDVILSFDLLGTGGLAWRMAQDLGIPATGWATGDDVRVSASSWYGRVLMRTIESLNVVFYQSHELLEKAASVMGVTLSDMSHDRHLVLPRGIPEPPLLDRVKVRNRVRRELGIDQEQVLVLSIGRVSREKGVFELIDAAMSAAAQDSRITCLQIGSSPAFDETAEAQKKLKQPGAEQKVKILPACSPDKVWEYLCAADIFAFTSHHEGMPNSLLEAMAAGLPTVAFAIPPVREVEAGTGSLFLVPPFNTRLFSEAILCLAASPGDRAQMGQIGRTEVMNRFMVKKNMASAVDRLAKIVGIRT